MPFGMLFRIPFQDALVIALVPRMPPKMPFRRPCIIASGRRTLVRMLFRSPFHCSCAKDAFRMPFGMSLPSLLVSGCMCDACKHAPIIAPGPEMFFSIPFEDAPPVAPGPKMPLRMHFRIRLPSLLGHAGAEKAPSQMARSRI